MSRELPGPGDLWAGPDRDVCDYCDEGESCWRCDPDLEAELRAEANID